MARKPKPPKEPAKMGRPPHIPTEGNKKAIILARAGRMNMDDVAKFLGISVETINKYYSEAVISGKVMLHLKVMDAFVKNIEKGDTALIKFFMVSEMGFKDKSEINVTTPESIDDLSVSEANKILAGLIIEGTATDVSTSVPNRSLLSAPVHDETSGHGK